jgi:hypothetical protein
VVKAESFPEGHSFLFQIEASISVDKPTPVIIGIAAETGVIVDFQYWIYSRVKRHVSVFYVKLISIFYPFYVPGVRRQDRSVHVRSAFAENRPGV